MPWQSWHNWHMARWANIYRERGKIDYVHSQNEGEARVADVAGERTHSVQPVGSLEGQPHNTLLEY